MKTKALKFVFGRYKFDKKKGLFTFAYRIDFLGRKPLKFTETIILPRVPKTLDLKQIRGILEGLQLILGISYYKLYCPPRIELAFKLSKEQAEFWDTVYRKGLGEFLYRTKLDPRKLAKFPYSKVKINSKRFEVNGRALVGIGGGKDSIMASELLKNFDTASFLVETQREDPASRRIIKTIGGPSLKIKRTLDPKIFDKHEGAYNGHIPFSVVIALLGFLTAAIYKYKYVVVANEHSTNFGNIKYKGEEVNHAWSKTSEFESMMQEYTKKFITPDISYFSLTRPFYGIRVVREFSKHKKYFSKFTSCNKNFRAHKVRPDTLWCAECPKCAYMFMSLSAFLNKKDVLKIFPKNLFARPELLPLFQDLLGLGKMKPFDCVGTFEENQVAFSLAAKKFSKDVIVKKLIPKIKNAQKFTKQVFSTVPALTLPTPFRFLGIKNVCLIGYGKEGRVTEKYLKKTYPHLKISILDERLDKNYLDKQENFDLAVKTPGIPKEKVRISYVTATNIFFALNKNFVIGVTGSKGKSTTVSLIYEILKAGGKKVRLLGNIGNPMLEVLMRKVNPSEIFVIELSSYMLDDIEYSPNIALPLNLFPDHMNYHGGVENYYQAKQNIFKFQKNGDVAIKPPFTEKIPLSRNEIPLLGDHNLKNIQAAIKVARTLNVPDSAIKKGIKNFKPLPHRLEFVGTYKGIKFYDDAVSTTPESTIMAIKALKNIGTILLGGEDRGYDFRELETIFRKYKIRNVVLFPDSGAHILKSRKGLNILETRSMKRAVNFAFKNTKRGQSCLLSTASPSYSIWKNFEEKGDLFQKFVKQHD